MKGKVALSYVLDKLVNTTSLSREEYRKHAGKRLRELTKLLPKEYRKREHIETVNYSLYFSREVLEILIKQSGLKIAPFMERKVRVEASPSGRKRQEKFFKKIYEDIKSGECQPSPTIIVRRYNVSLATAGKILRECGHEC